MKSFRKEIKVVAVFMFLLCQAVTAQVWEEIGINLPAGDTVSHNTIITFTNKNIGWLFTQYFPTSDPDRRYGNLYRTTDGGQNWVRIIRGSYVIPDWTVLYSVEPDFCYLIRGKRALFTTDGGATWDSTVIDLGGRGSSTLYFFNEQKGITFGSNSMVTTDGGKTWMREGEISAPLDVYFYNDKIGWAVGWSVDGSDGDYIAKTTDGCETWEYQNEAFGEQVDYHGIEFIDSLKGFAVNGAVAKTTDGGKNWTYLQDVRGYDVGFLDNKNGWIIAGNQISRTTDGGETWELQFEGVEDYLFAKLIILKKDKAAYVLGINPVGDKATLLKADLSSITGIEENKQDIPEKYNLAQNYPNPFNPATNISYSIPQSPLLRGVGGVFVTLKIYDILGREITTLVNEEKKPGSYKVSFNAGGYNLTSGVYIARLTAGNYSHSIKLILQK